MSIDNVIYNQFKIKLYPEQKKAIKYLTNGYFVEVKTGEGKSLINIVTAYELLKQKKHEHIYIVSVNDYLAQRDFKKFKTVFKQLGYTVEFNKSEGNKEKIHSSNVIFTSTYNLVFDYLRYRIGDLDIKVNLDGAIIDEADFVLLDNATSQFNISSSNYKEIPLNEYIMSKYIISTIDSIGIIKNTYEGTIDCSKLEVIVDRVNGTSYLTDLGIRKIETNLCQNLINTKKLYKAINDSLTALFNYKKDRDYIVENNKVVLINKFDGRKMKNSKYENGLQLAIELKEEVRTSSWTNSNISISYQIFYGMFKDIYGLSGTLKGLQELKDIYNKKIKVIKPHKKSRREELPQIITKCQDEKIDILLQIVHESINDPQPILIIASSDQEAKEIYDKLKKLKMKNINLLVCSNCESKEEEYVKSAGKINHITISTLLSSRGTDIKIDNSIEKIGGLKVISLVYKNERINEQIKGRCARQGQKGVVQFIYSLEDETFDSLQLRKREYLKKMNSRLFKLVYVQKKLSKLALKSQKRKERLNSDHRKVSFYVESILERQKQIIENKFLVTEEELKKNLKKFIQTEINEKIYFIDEVIEDKQNSIKQLTERLEKIDTINDLVIKKLISVALYENYEAYREQNFDYIKFFNLTKTNDVYKFISFNKEIFERYVKQVTYTFLKYLLRIEKCM